MDKQVKIYVLIDPLTCRVRYIGRTTCSLNKRLAEHISRCKSGKTNTHKDNWIRSLLKINSKPYIKQIAEIQGWKESHEFEINLIGKYKDRLVNHDDRGMGSQKSITEKAKVKISNTLKLKYKDGLPNVARKTIYAYNVDGSFYKEYISIKEAANDLNIYFKTISKHINKWINNGKPTKDGRARFLRNGKQFNTMKVDKMFDYTKKE